MKSKISIILSIISLFGVLVVIGLWLLGNMKLSVVSLDSFIGIVVALLAIVFTVIVGWQIVNAIDVKEEMKTLQLRQDAILENERRMLANANNYVELAHNLQCGISDSNADLYVAKGLYVEAFGCRHTSLHQAIMAGQTNLQNRIKGLQLLNQFIVAPPTADFSLIKTQIETETQLIRNTEVYKQCLSMEYEQTMQVFWQKMKVMGAWITWAMNSFCLL